MAPTATRMSWTRRVLVMLAFVLMVGGVALMVTQREELYLAASAAGFALVLAAVPSLPRQRATDAEAAGEDEVAGAVADAPTPRRKGSGSGQDGAALGTREWTGNVTVLPRPAGEPAASERGAPAEPGEAAASGHDAPSEPGQAATPEHGGPVEAGQAATPEHGASAEAEGERAAGPLPRAPARDAGEQPPAAAPPRAADAPPAAAASEQARPSPSTPGSRASAADVSPRGLAIAGAAAGAMLWLWRRARR